MAQKVILYIQSDPNDVNSFVKVDLYKDEKVSLTMTLQDIRDIEKVRTDFSQPFTVPASDQNNLLFQHWYNADIVGFNSNFRTPAILELNYLPFRNGFIKLNSVKMKDNKPQFYNITFLGETVDLKNVISEDQLSQLTFLNSQGLIFANNNSSARQGLNQGLTKTDADGTVWSKAYVYPLISHSVAFNYTSNPPQGFLNYTNLWANSSQTQSGCFYNDLKPAIRVDLILRAIEKRYTIANGYTSNLVFSNDFFFTSATENLYLWMSRNKGPIKGGGSLDASNLSMTFQNGTPSNTIAQQFFQGNYTPDLTQGICYSDALQFTSIECTANNLSVQLLFGTYPTQPTFTRQFRVKYFITPCTGFENVPYTWEIYNDTNDEVVATSVNVQSNQIAEHTVSTGGYAFNGFINSGEPFEQVTLPYVANYSLRLSSSDFLNFSISMRVQYYGPLTEVFAFGQAQCQESDTYINVLGNYFANTSCVPLEVDIIPTQQLPEIKILDFLTGLFKTYNLTAYFENGITVVKTLDDFYSDFQEWDLTKLVHADKHTISEALPFSEINFTYPEPKSILAQTFEQINNRKYGELRFIASASKQGTYQVKSPFEHMLYERMNDETTGNLLTIQQGTFLDDNLNPSFGKPLLFYAIQNSDSSNTLINWVNGIRPVDVSEEPQSGQRQPFRNYMMVSNSNELGSSTVAPTINLNYGSEINTYNLTDYGGNNNSLFQNYYTNYIQRVFNRQNRLYAFEVKLPIEFLTKFKLSDKIQIGNRQYLINKISADLTTGESKMELLNIF